METTGQKTTSARTREARELFTPLGSNGRWFYFRSSCGMVLWFTPCELSRVGPALAIYPDIDHWRSLYPSTRERDGRVDWARVGADLLAACQVAGVYKPQPEEGPRPVGRPRLDPVEKARRAEARRIRKNEARRLKPHVAAWARSRRD